MSVCMIDVNVMLIALKRSNREYIISIGVHMSVTSGLSIDLLDLSPQPQIDHRSHAPGWR